MPSMLSDKDMLGPGSYSSQINLMGKDNLESMSRKGYGSGFISKAKRFN